MILFVFLFFLLLVISYNKCSKISLVLILLIFSVLIGFRGTEVGADTITYMQIYDFLGERGYEGYPEIGYAFFNLLFYKLGFNFHFFQWGMSLIMLGFIGKVILVYSPNRGFSLFILYALFFVFYAMNVFRQMFAVSIVIFAYHLLYRGFKIKFIVCVLLATLFHSISLLALGALWLPRLRVTNKIFYSGIIFSLLLGCFVLSDSLFVRIAGPYASYLLENENGFRSDVRVMQAVLLAVFWSSLCVFIYSFIEKVYRDNYWFKIYFVAVILNNLLLRLELGLRVVFYFSIVQIILFSIFIVHNRLAPPWSAHLIVTLYLAIFFFLFLSNGSAGILPYCNILFE